MYPRENADQVARTKSERGIRMKKIFMILAVIAMILVSAAAAEETNDPLAGAWYSAVNGKPIQMNLAEAGTYTLMIPGMETLEGTWEAQDGFICMDGVRPPELTILDENLLKWSASPLFFSREEVKVYAPAETKAETSSDSFEGYWKSSYVDVGGTAVPAMAEGDETDLYIEGTSAILGGPVLGDTLVRMSFENGMLCCTEGGEMVKIELQEDEFLRLTVTGSDATEKTWYLLPAYSALLDSEATEAAPAT